VVRPNFQGRGIGGCGRRNLRRWGRSAKSIPHTHPPHWKKTKVLGARFTRNLTFLFQMTTARPHPLMRPSDRHREKSSGLVGRLTSLQKIPLNFHCILPGRPIKCNILSSYKEKLIIKWASPIPLIFSKCSAVRSEFPGAIEPVADQQFEKYSAFLYNFIKNESPIPLSLKHKFLHKLQHFLTGWMFSC